MGRPSVQTGKKLFALSGNQCAYPRCKQRLIDPQTKSLTARICHIKGNRDGSARYDKDQPEAERQGLANLVAMCATHSDVIDDLKNVKKHSVEWLLDVKDKHEAKLSGDAPPSDELAEDFAAAAIVQINASQVVHTQNQSGGQAANTIYNVHLLNAQLRDAFNDALQDRHLSDPSAEDFCKTKYSKRHCRVNYDGTSAPLHSSGILFAWFPQELMGPDGKDAFLQWMDINKRRYDPVKNRFFIPSMQANIISKGYMWQDGERYRAGSKEYQRYLVVEPSGYIECGFYPGHVADPAECIYYAKVLANAAAFIQYLEDLCSVQKIAAESIGFGLAMRGIGGLILRGIRQSIRHSNYFDARPEDGSLLYVHRPEDGPWTASGAAAEIAHAILEHWSFSVPAYQSLPEFEGEQYTGEFFKGNFAGELA